jgi:hypothetical protein
MECNAERVQVEAAQHDYLARMRTSSSRSKHSINLDRMLEKR